MKDILTDWIEWIPNVSTSDPKVLNLMERSLSQIENVYVLHTDRGTAEMNRTVFSIVSDIPGLRASVFVILGILQEHTDMRLHHGTHPRLGALDVSPFVPLNASSKPKVIREIRRLASDISEKFDLPVYLYEDSATRPDRRNLADIRKGEYEGLKSKMGDPAWHPDFGKEFNPRLGGTVMGVRDFLIAYNVNLPTPDIPIAKTIAAQIREKGRPGRPFALKGVKAIGWFLEENNICQISTNIVDTIKANPLLVFHQVKKLAEGQGLLVTESEIIGLLPWPVARTMMDTLPGDSRELTQFLGLKYAGINDLLERVIEYRMFEASSRTLFKELFETL